MLVFRNETKGIVSGIIRKSVKSDIIDINNILKDVFGADLTDRNCCYREIVEHSIKDRFYVFEEAGTQRVIACTGLTKSKDGYEVDWTGTMRQYQGFGIMNKLLCLQVNQNPTSIAVLGEFLMWSMLIYTVFLFPMGLNLRVRM